MPDNSNTVRITLAVSDDGTIKIIDQARTETHQLGETTAKASAKGTAGLKQLRAGWFELAAGVTAGYFTIKKGIDAITGLVDVAAEAEEIEKRAAFQMETWGYSFQKIKPYVDAFANSVQQATRFSDEMARQALGSMLQYTSSVEEGMKGVRLAMDMSTQTGMDLNSTIRYLGMAMAGNVEMLGRWIPELRDLKTVLGENATEAEKAAYTMELLNKRFGGAAQKDLQGYRGQLASLKNQWDDIKETIGYALMPYTQEWIAGTKSLLNDLFPAAVKTKEQIEAIAEAEKKAAEQAHKLAAEHAAAVTPPDFKKWVEEWDDLSYSFEKLGIISTETLTKSADRAIVYSNVIKKAFQEGRASVADYVRALNAASDAMKKLVGEDLTGELVKNEEEYQRRIRQISFDDPERQKKVQAVIDDWLRARKEIEKSMTIPVQADVAPAERELQSLIDRASQYQIKIPVYVETEEGGGAIETLEDWGAAVGKFFNSADQASKNFLKDWTDIKQEMGHPIDVTIDFVGSGSSKKPIMEKIEEIIQGFGGIEGALSGLKANIEFIGLSSQLKQLERQLKNLESVTGGITKIVQWTGSDWWVNPGVSSYLQQYALTSILPIKAEIERIKAQMAYQSIAAYGGTMQAGTKYIPMTGLYMLHQGEEVKANHVSNTMTNNFHISGGDERTIAAAIDKVLKYRLTDLGKTIKKQR